MKRGLTRLTVAVLMIGMWSQLHAENRLKLDVTVPSFRAATTGNKVRLVLQNSDPIKAIQMKAVSNTPGLVLKELERASRTLNDSWTVQYHSVSEGRLSVLIANLGSELFQAGDGAIAEIVFDVNESITEGFLALSLEEIKAADTQGRPIEVLFSGESIVAVGSEVNAQFIVDPLAVSLSIGNRSEISKLRFEARLEGATSIAQPVLSGRAEGMRLQFEQSSDRVIVELEDIDGISIKPGSGKVLEIPIHSSWSVRFVVQELSLLGSSNTALESRLSVVESSPQPQRFALHQNYPNPFNPTTTIAYDLRSPARVTLKVYNAYGQEVSTLVQEKQPAGQYSFLWNGTNDWGEAVSSGTYIYRLTAGESSVTKKMILVK